MITNSNHKQAENTQNIKTRKTNLLKDYVKNVDLYKPVLNKIMTRHE